MLTWRTRTHTHTHCALFIKWNKGGGGFIPYSAAKLHLHNRGYNSQSGIDFFWFVWLRRCEECTSGAARAARLLCLRWQTRALCSSTGANQHNGLSCGNQVHRYETRRHQNRRNVPKQTKRSGDNPSVSSLARLFSQEQRKCRFFFP